MGDYAGNEGEEDPKDDEPGTGYHDFTPHYVVDPKTGERVEVSLPADAVPPTEEPGARAGNPLVDRINRQLERERIIEETIESRTEDQLPE